MNLFLIHHAEALGPEVDPQRPLSTPGLAHAERMAHIAKERGAAPQVIWHSGKLRSRQTGEAFLRVCAPFAQFKMVRGLGPGDPPAIMLNTLLAESRDVALVGHWPHLPALLEALSPTSAPMPQHGVVALHSEDHGLTWLEAWRTAQ
jgi:phosphohistidine phosphatase